MDVSLSDGFSDEHINWIANSWNNTLNRNLTNVCQDIANKFKNSSLCNELEQQTTFALIIKDK